MFRLRVWIGDRKKLLKPLGGLILALVALAFIATTWGVIRPPVERQTSPLLVNDVTQLNPIAVGRVIAPTTTAEVVAAVLQSPGPISVGGSRHSMGGQIATAGALYIDMRNFDQIIDFSPTEKTITVQAGTRWRKIQERIDSTNLSVKIMQTFANFTVGGSLSVNAHGRYIGQGPLVRSVKSLQVVLADGSLLEASPTHNADVFYGVIGGYGGLGVITEVTLDLVDNVRVKRQHRAMRLAEYRQYFFDQVRGSPSAVFHNADIYPDDYMQVNSVTYSATTDPVTVQNRLVATNQSYWPDRFMLWVISEWPLSNVLRRHLVDPIYFSGEPVTWRNYEASYDVAELEPSSRTDSTYVLEEYFVPVERFDDFAALMRDVLRRHRVHVINVSIRHATQDPGSLLAWARTEVFAFVIYYKQETTDAAKKAVAVWTRELIDAALSVGGSYYLPYQLHATEEQFLRAYPRARELFALKHRLDPTNKFRNELWNKYYHP
jgi:FAD/FMN-containing dehydrogenase